MNSTEAKNWRSQVVVGELPADFLRLSIADDHCGALNYSAYSNHACHGNITSSRLKISICEAKLVKNYGLTRMDPYCKLQVGMAIHETPTATNGGCNPVWNQNMHISIPADIDYFTIDIYDERTFSADEKIGWAKIEIPVEARKGATIDQWFPLSGKQGTNEEGSIHLILSIINMQSSNAQQLAYEYMESIAASRPITCDQTSVDNAESVTMATEQAEALLGEMFPTFDVDVVRYILQSCAYNKEEAISILLNMHNA